MSTTANVTLSPRARSAVYLGALVVTVVTGLVSGAWAIIDPGHAMQAAALAGVVTTATATLTSGLGVAFRPTGPAGTELDVPADGTVDYPPGHSTHPEPPAVGGLETYTGSSKADATWGPLGQPAA